MSTGRDNEKIVYMFPNQIKEETHSTLNSTSNLKDKLTKSVTSPVLKVENLRNSTSTSASLTKQQVASSALDSMKANILTLNELHSRLNFLLEEIEELERN